MELFKGGFDDCLVDECFDGGMMAVVLICESDTCEYWRGTNELEQVDWDDYKGMDLRGCCVEEWGDER